MARYIDADKLIEFITKGLNNPDNTKAFGYDAIVILTEIEYAPTADVAPKGEVAKEVLSDLKKAIRNKAVYPRYKDSDPYIRLKDVDEIIEDYLKRKTGG
jgi:hypothetical protein